MQKIRSYEEGKSDGEDLQPENIPRLGEKWSGMYKWLLALMEYIEVMVCRESKTLRTDIVVLQVAAGIGEREEKENIANKKKESGEDYAKKILEFLEAA